VVNNLVINASQAMAGGGTVRVAVENRELRASDRVALPEGRYVAITVADAGAGIAEEHLPRIFDPYFTTKQEGSGLGLAVCYAIVQNHGGAIAVRSANGAGTTFTVYLPATAEPAPPPRPAEPALPKGGGRVLLMDDDAMIRSVAGRVLKALGYEVETANDGRAALAAWAAARDAGRPFAAAIFDLTVPGGMGGLETVRELLALDPGAKAIVSSGYHQDPIMANYREHGFRDVVAKPFGAAELGKVVARVIAEG
jgi:CheY-like chemotaxis protein